MTGCVKQALSAARTCKLTYSASMRVSCTFYKPCDSYDELELSGARTCELTYSASALSRTSALKLKSAIFSATCRQTHLSASPRPDPIMLMVLKCRP